MKILTFVVLLSMLLFGGVFSEKAIAANCDVSAAVKVQGMFLDTGCFWTTTSNTVKFQWGSDWDYYDKKTKLKMIEIAANADACIAGKARYIKFYRRNVFVGEASDLGFTLK